MKKGKDKKKSFDKSGVGEILVRCLTKEQIAQLLNVVFAVVDVEEYADELKKTDLDMAETVEKVLAISSGKNQKRPVDCLASNKRLLEHWDLLWNQWDNIVIEVGDEKGKYVIQEVHWEPPYFDGYTPAEDLDEIAKDMLDHINDVYDMVKKPELFYDAIEEIDSNISLYPEWFGTHEGCPLGKNTTQCVLKWLWLGSQKDTHPGTVFLAQVCELEEKFENVYLDDAENVSFFANLPDVVCKEIYEQFKDNKYKLKVEETHLKWHKINHLYEERFDSSKYIETCQKHLHENWQYGKPLIDDAIAKGDYQKAESLLQKTFLSYLHRDEKNIWYPEVSLLIVEYRYYSQEENKEKIAKLLNLWAEVSEKIGNLGRSAASRLQNVMYRTPDDCDKVIYEYRKFQQPEVKNIIDFLFSKWQTEMCQWSVQGGINKNISSDTWIHWLIETKLGLDMTGKKELFLKKLQVWLDGLNNNEKMFKQQRVLLARLTKDLDGSNNLLKQYPTFFKIVLPSDSWSSKLDKERCKGLKEVNADTYLIKVMEIWKKYLCLIVPDPAESYKSRYDEHARWMKALYELSHEEYKNLLLRWQKTHRQRRNLWLDMKNQQLPV